MYVVYSVCYNTSLCVVVRNVKISSGKLVGSGVESSSGSVARPDLFYFIMKDKIRLASLFVVVRYVKISSGKLVGSGVNSTTLVKTY